MSESCPEKPLRWKQYLGFVHTWKLGEEYVLAKLLSTLKWIQYASTLCASVASAVFYTGNFFARFHIHSEPLTSNFKWSKLITS